LKDKINELATNSKNKNFRELYRGIIKFKMGYQLRSNVVKNRIDDNFLADSHNIFNKWNYISLLLKEHCVSEFRQIEIYRAEPLVLDPSILRLKLLLLKFKTCKLPDCDQIPAELFKVGGEMFRCDIGLIFLKSQII
jgi:hypothetical protein